MIHYERRTPLAVGQVYEVTFCTRTITSFPDDETVSYKMVYNGGSQEVKGTITKVSFKHWVKKNRAKLKEEKKSA